MELKEFADIEEVAAFDGKEGRPVYVVHQGKVYDLSASKLWKGGLHMRRHHAGGDLTVDISAAPHGSEVLERFPVVGRIREPEGPSRPMHEGLAWLLKRFPLLRRHPHPMTVHFPIAFFLATTAFTLLSLLTGVDSLEVTAFHCMAAGLLFMPLVMVTGLFTWWLNYMAKPNRPVTIKIYTSLVLLAVALVAFVWRASCPNLLSTFTLSSLVYFVLILSFAPLVSVIGWFGAKLTFPVEGE